MQLGHCHYHAETDLSGLGAQTDQLGFFEFADILSIAKLGVDIYGAKKGIEASEDQFKLQEKQLQLAAERQRAELDLMRQQLEAQRQAQLPARQRSIATAGPLGIPAWLPFAALGAVVLLVLMRKK